MTPEKNRVKIGDAGCVPESLQQESHSFPAARRAAEDDDVRLGLREQSLRAWLGAEDPISQRFALAGINAAELGVSMVGPIAAASAINRPI
jgi:hypothetical protein